MEFTKNFSLISTVLLLLSSLNASSVRVINGDKVSVSNEKYRSTVALLDVDNLQFCGATLISSTWVLTAAHCLEGMSKNEIKVLLNTYDLQNMEQTLSVKRIISHPEYDNIELYNDIGLIELSSSVSNVPSIPINTKTSLATNQDAWVAGWGLTSVDTESFPDELRDALVPIINTSTCNTSDSYDGALDNTQICAGYMDGLKDSCQGDSGGPLIVQNNGIYELAGIVSYGGSDTQACGAANFPGVYTNVQSFSSWINTYTYTYISTDTDTDTKEEEKEEEEQTPKTTLNATDISNFDFNQWYLTGTTSAITDLSIFNDMEILFIYQDGIFKAYSPTLSTREILQKKGYEIFNSIPANSGIWIKK